MRRDDWGGFNDRFKEFAAEFARHRQEIDQWECGIAAKPETRSERADPGSEEMPFGVALKDLVHRSRWFAPRRLLPASSPSEAVAEASRLIDLAQGIRALRARSPRPSVEACVTAAILVFEAHDITRIDGRVARVARRADIRLLESLVRERPQKGALERLRRSPDASALLESARREWPHASLQEVAERLLGLLSIHRAGKHRPVDYAGRCYVATVAYLSEQYLQVRPSANGKSLFRKVLSLAEEATRPPGDRRQELLVAGTDSDTSPKVRLALQDWRDGQLPTGLALVNRNALTRLVGAEPSQ